MKLYFAAAVLSAAFISSCHFMGGEKIRGNGDIKTETRKEHDFQNLEVSGAIEVYVKQDSVYSVKIETDSNLFEHIETFTNNNTLVIKPKDNVNLKSSSSVKVYVSGPRFNQLDVSGASHVYTEGRISSADALRIELSGASSAKMDVKSPKIDLEVTGASAATLTGETRDLTIEGQGASHANCYGLLSEKAAVDVSGASEAEVSASLELDADASGASNIRYKGNATLVRKSESGAGSVRKV